MKLKDAIIEAVGKHDGQTVGNISDFMRFNLNMNYSMTYKLFHELTNISLADFDGLLHEADYYEN